MGDGPLAIADQVKLALERYAGLAHLGYVQDASDTERRIQTPDPGAYALGWIVANAIIQQRYASSGIDVMPVYHPDSGWDRFLISRRVACNHRTQEAADRFGSILMREDGSLQLLDRDGTPQLDLSDHLRRDPDGAVQEVLDRIPTPGLGPANHERCWHVRAAGEYPLLYDVIAHLVIEQPGLIPAREIYIDDAQTDGGFHPLFIHTAGQVTGFNYDWFAVESGAGLVYIRLHGHGIVFRTERGTWRSEAIADSDLNRFTLKVNLANRLRIDPEALSLETSP